MKKQKDSFFLPHNKILQAQEIFLKEAEKRLIDGEESLKCLLSDADDAEAFSGLYRFVHTLKGSGEMVGLRDLSALAGEVVTVLNLVRKYGVKLDAGIQSFLAEKIDEIHQQIEERQQRRKKKNSRMKKAGLEGVGNKKILVVDDDPTITRLIQESLTVRGFKVLTSHDFEEAEKTLRNEKPDLIVLDIIFPQGNGIEFCRKIRSEHFGKVVPIIFLSVKDDLQDRLSGFACGADDYISKPFVIEELIARITAIFTRVRKYEHLVMKDELTGSFNRRYLSQRLYEEVELAMEKKGSFSLAMVDLDKFKAINDRYGHGVGDEVLKYFVKILKENLRDSDIICRCGGDEFVIIMPETALAEALAVLERVRTHLKANPYRLEPKSTDLYLPFSAGVVNYPESGTSAKELLEAADKAMYQAKESGENRVYVG